MKLSKKELMRRIRITKPYTAKRMMYGLMFIANHCGITVQEFIERNQK